MLLKEMLRHEVMAKILLYSDCEQTTLGMACDAISSCKACKIRFDRSNYNVMNKYVSNKDNLKILMKFLEDRSENIQFKAFHVFNVQSF
ncbi:uncharacterized protein MELLADRAFT_95613 [Melampsora larici-populina 98AG31]|uniref:Uncharacterized protein n=1 Tax=Melampsora larici-populina (strain 98AG31 / pathotype 3-4-7) TaxID=747676 RepID=F4S9Z2_MELLP|nr:uncharacterized protein MELLADRAFT_95613 [Melampsora larici-populina 98AG31]EGF98546.1 hypothetical protein MELLADRAFT_95613 [Melampsora larici-populina 98AG31]